MSFATAVYSCLPRAAQHAAVTMYGAYWYWLRFGSGFKRFVDGYMRREQFTEAEWKAWQSEQLRQLLREAAYHVPYYRSAWSNEQKHAAECGELSALPLLEKNAIRAAPEAFLNERLPRFPRWGFHTSGTTGTPIKTYWKVAEIRDSLAVREARSARWAGVSFTMPRATFSGRMVEPDPQSSGPFYRSNAVERQAYLSPFHLGPATAAQYVEALKRTGVQWLTGYAVSYYLLARHILDQKLSVPPLRAVITTSEKLTAEMRAVMEEAYRCRVFEEYSTVENALFASECEKGRLHVSPDVGVVEILHPDGTACKPGEVGEVVTTCLMRGFQPFIRYRLGDLATWDDEPCPCGRAMPVLKEVVGRIEDVVIGPDGREMVRFHGIFVDQPHVCEGQIVQEALDRITVRIVTAPGFGMEDERDIVRRIQQRMGSRVTVRVECVESIPRSSSGKYKSVVSLVPYKEHYHSAVYT